MSLAAPSPALRQAKKQHIHHLLLVEDNPSQARRLKTVLEGEGLAVSIVKDDAEAIEQANKHNFDLFIFDVEQPALKGYEICRRLRIKPLTANIPVIFLTDPDCPLDTLTDLGLGVVDYISKDASAEAALVQTIRLLNKGGNLLLQMRAYYKLQGEDKKEALPSLLPYPISELAEFLRPYHSHFCRPESLQFLKQYVAGLLADIEGKTDPGVAVTGLSREAIYYFIGQTTWDEVALNQQRLGTMLAYAAAGDGMIVINELGLPRTGKKCIGVEQQPCPPLDQAANCQVLVMANYIDPYYAWPVLGQLYLPQSWTNKPAQRQAAQIPDKIGFQTKSEIALDLIDRAQTAGVPFNLIGTAGRYGDDLNFLDSLDKRQLSYLVPVSGSFGVSRPSEFGPVEPGQMPFSGRADQVMAVHPGECWQTIIWRIGSDDSLTKQFVALRVNRGHDQATDSAGWLIGERPLPGHPGHCHYYWSNLPVDTSLSRLAELVHRCLGGKRSYQDGRSAPYLGRYAARLWRNFHRHLAIEMLALSWLILQQARPNKIEIVLEPAVSETAGEAMFSIQPCS